MWHISVEKTLIKQLFKVWWKILFASGMDSFSKMEAAHFKKNHFRNLPIHVKQGIINVQYFSRKDFSQAAFTNLIDSVVHISSRSDFQLWTYSQKPNKLNLKITVSKIYRFLWKPDILNVTYFSRKDLNQAAVQSCK